MFCPLFAFAIARAQALSDQANESTLSPKQFNLGTFPLELDSFENANEIFLTMCKHSPRMRTGVDRLGQFLRDRENSGNVHA
jgi:hypothetical protein